ncbi:hypothetical protein [Oryza sativa Japonica Group]|uniref:Os01g0530000 protein n=1 Tax=Oryza sativa subsp. japonica TaxID=39947 RepID=A0A0P0V3J6_ORYSJ|nr:hypothetical protein OsJ_02070 [Oryza sativa Japonica Group]BAB91852.1 hypothetical protein [Oryza sativa Japonica Group]BAS72499.1 Os01g0530000 [Oryza sativa Japonica Group]
MVASCLSRSVKYPLSYGFAYSYVLTPVVHGERLRPLEARDLHRLRLKANGPKWVQVNNRAGLENRQASKLCRRGRESTKASRPETNRGRRKRKQQQCGVLKA